jgi:hypothetical protein
MKAKMKAMKFKFLDLPVRSRNRATALLNEIKIELRKSCALKDLGVDSASWDNVNLNLFLELPKEHYLRLINSKSETKEFRQDLIRQMNALYSLFSKKKRRRRVKK